MLSVNICVYMDVCVCKAREPSKIKLFHGSELPLLLDQASPQPRIRPQKQRQKFLRLLLLLHTPGGQMHPHLSRFGGRNRKSPPHRSPLHRLLHLKKLPWLFPTPKLPLLLTHLYKLPSGSESGAERSFLCDPFPGNRAGISSSRWRLGKLGERLL